MLRFSETDLWYLLISHSTFTSRSCAPNHSRARLQIRRQSELIPCMYQIYFIWYIVPNVTPLTGTYNLSVNMIVITSIMKCEMKLLVYSQTSKVQPSRCGDGKVISSHTLLGMWLSVHAGIESIHVSTTNPWSEVVAMNAYTGAKFESINTLHTLKIPTLIYGNCIINFSHDWSCKYKRVFSEHQGKIHKQTITCIIISFTYNNLSERIHV